MSLDTAPAWLPHPHVAQQSGAVEESFSKNLSLFKLLTLEALPHGILHGNEPQCINTFNSQYHSVHGAYIIQLLTYQPQSNLPIFFFLSKISDRKIYIKSNLTILRIFQISVWIQTNGILLDKKYVILSQTI